jgi:Flp pilus assembly protein TadD
MAARWRGEPSSPIQRITARSVSEMNRGARNPFVLAVLLAVLTLAVYWPVRHMEFTNYDDPGYVADQPKVQRGLTADGLAWAFSTWHSGNWYPLTWLSFMLDAQLFGRGAAGFHTVNLLFHAANTVLLFLLFGRLTGALWRSAFVAALFALHPLHVESVAWVAERKDVLSAFFFLLSLLAYGRYARKRSKAESRESSSNRPLDPGLWTVDYALALLFFVLGLMSKPTVVTLPFVLLLLDYWPLQRWKMDSSTSFTANWRHLLRALLPARSLVVEKLPFFVLSGASCVVTFFALKTEGIPQSLVRLPTIGRIENGLVSYARYLGKLFWPLDLAVMYPHPGRWPRVLVVLSAILLAGLGYGAFRFRRRFPFVMTGWFWFFGMLIPVIGLVQGAGFQSMEDRGFQCMADRYTYLPAIGVFIILAWGAAAAFRRWSWSRMMIGAVAGLVMAACTLRTADQLRHWQDSESLFRHALAVTENSFLAHNKLGEALFHKGEVDKAMAEFRAALELLPRHPLARNNFGFSLLQKGEVDQAIAQIRQALEVAPGFELAHKSLGVALLRKGRLDEAIGHLRTAVEIQPDDAEAHCNLALALSRQGLVDEAITHFQKALELNPDDEVAHNNLGLTFLSKGLLADAINSFETALTIEPRYTAAHSSLAAALLQSGRPDQAIVHFQKLLEIEPRNIQILNNLAWVLATCPEASLRNGADAVELADQANRLCGDTNSTVLDTLAAAQAEVGRFPEAVATAQRALQLVCAQSDTARIRTLKARIELYQARSPFRDPGITNSTASPNQP